eukprot:CAMPEP_0171240858 /NCGR_PEP_ID=MMETSP0790-20130122/44764_1 /TAXON_ID=2925 /ORGANISM="Alexandrium catenella, Strain OF101" /LENGTH=44 /DNA_ID= /DNA_START= /DNA_END= /DNA_ORIENTATION=
MACDHNDGAVTVTGLGVVLVGTDSREKHQRSGCWWTVCSNWRAL